MQESQKVLVPVILSGGAGSRLWPVSRALHPKPFIKLADGESLLQKSFIRAASLAGVNEVMTVTNREFYFKTDDEYGEVNSAAVPTSYVLEPDGRNTAPAVAAAAIQIQKKFGDAARMLVLTADHLVQDVVAFQAAVEEAIELADQGQLVTFGIQPDAPETGFGYIEAEGNKVKQFVEKPSLERAEAYLAQGNFLWNSGMFCFQAGTFLTEMTEHAPELMAELTHCVENSTNKINTDTETSQLELDSKCFALVSDISIDYALMEKSNNVAVVACDIGWSDIGSWEAFSGLSDSDERGNAINGDALLHNVDNCFIQSSERVVGAVGVDNLIIVDTPDALLVADRDSCQDVKQIVGQLKERGMDVYKLHSTVHRPWGTYTVLEEDTSFKIKHISVKPGASLSLQMHHHRSEHWIVVSGMAKVVNGDDEFFVNTNESTYIPAGHHHRLSNPGLMDLVMIEVQSGQYLGEDDIVRFEDVYGRSES